MPDHGVDKEVPAPAVNNQKTEALEQQVRQDTGQSLTVIHLTDVFVTNCAKPKMESLPHTGTAANDTEAVKEGPESGMYMW